MWKMLLKVCSVNDDVVQVYQADAPMQTTESQFHQSLKAWRGIGDARLHGTDINHFLSRTGLSL
jgi:hypothetical protein